MNDVLIALPAAVGIPALLLMLRMQQMGLPYERGKGAALTAIGHGSMALGIVIMLLLAILEVIAVVRGIVIYYDWKYRNIYSSDEEMVAALEGIRDLPYTRFTRNQILDHLLKKIAWHISSEARARRKRQDIQ